MKLKLHTDLSLRMLIYLSFKQRRARVEEIAEAFNVSRNHLVKVAQDLVRAGWVSARTGRGGGVELAVPPDLIDVGDVVAAIEGRNGVLDCISRPEVCVLEPGCRLRKKLIEAEDAFYQVLHGMTIADLCRTRGRKGGVLNLQPLTIRET